MEEQIRMILHLLYNKYFISKNVDWLQDQYWVYNGCVQQRKQLSKRFVLIGLYF